MSSALDETFVIYPMVEEHEATGRVAACFGAILGSRPFVPSLFKSLALCPDYLVLAWDQASHAMDLEAFATAADGLATTAAEQVAPVADDRVREALAAFVDPLGRMLLLSAGLLLGLEGALDGRQASAEAPPSSDATPSRKVPTQWEADADGIFDDIRSALGTPILNSVWRALAGDDLLEPAWSELAPRAARAREAGRGVQDDALSSARALEWPVVAGPDALRAAGVADVAPGMAAVLDAYVKTLARVLVLVAPHRMGDGR
jgi:hypothetical protein